MAAPKIGPRQTHEAVEAGDALLVCAYDDEEKCRDMALRNSLSLKQLEAELPRVEKDRRLIFYCA
jgi:hypothetical protein